MNRLVYTVNMQIIGHRGAAGLAPENTLESIQKALDIGVDWVEFDVHTTRDGKLVVIHSPSTRHIADQAVRVKKSDLATLRALPTRSHAIIPTFAEVVQLIGNRAKINVELKSVGSAKKVVDTISNLVAAGYSYDHFLVSSFRTKLLSEIQALDAKIPLSLLHYSVPVRYIVRKQLKLNLSAVGFHHIFVTAAFVKHAKSKGLFTYIFTVNNPKVIENYMAWGVDAIVTDHPERFSSLRPKTED